MSVDRRFLPVPDPPPGIRFPDLTRSELAPGLRLVTVERRDLPLVCLLWLWHAGTSADLVAAINGALLRFTERPPFDDLTLVVIKREIL